MAYFRQILRSRSAFHNLKTPFSDVTAFDAVIRSLVVDNPFGCAPYMKAGRNHPPIERVREMYTAKFVYRNAKGKRIGYGLEMYNSVEGYLYGIAAVVSNMANTSAHGGKALHTPDADRFSVTLKCNDPETGIFFVSLSRRRVTVSQYAADTILRRVVQWTTESSALA